MRTRGKTGLVAVCVLQLGCMPLPRSEDIDVDALANCQVEAFAEAALAEQCCQACVSMGTETGGRLVDYLSAVQTFRWSASAVLLLLVPLFSWGLLAILSKSRRLRLWNACAIVLLLTLLAHWGAYTSEQVALDAELAGLAGADQALREAFALGVLKDTGLNFLRCGEQVSKNALDGACAGQAERFGGVFEDLSGAEAAGRQATLVGDKAKDLSKFFSTDTTLAPENPRTTAELFATNDYLEAARSVRGGWVTDPTPLLFGAASLLGGSLVFILGAYLRAQRVLQRHQRLLGS